MEGRLIDGRYIDNDGRIHVKLCDVKVNGTNVTGWISLDYVRRDVDRNASKYDARKRHVGRLLVAR